MDSDTLTKFRLGVHRSMTVCHGLVLLGHARLSRKLAFSRRGPARLISASPMSLPPNIEGSGSRVRAQDCSDLDRGILGVDYRIPAIGLSPSPAVRIGRSAGGHCPMATTTRMLPRQSRAWCEPIRRSLRLRGRFQGPCPLTVCTNAGLRQREAISL